MKKIFIGLLILAAGTGAYFLLKQPQTPTPDSENRTVLLQGNWVARFPATGKDSLFTTFQYAFLQDGLALIRDTATATTDSSYYAWSKTGDLLFKEKQTDSVAVNTYTVLLLNKDSLLVKDTANKEYLFTRL
ncbi:MAG: hypothetical protein J0M10_18300 [Chitinophagales bacterium]|nr:hypothetical protein [Chitinophagales bacterium]